MIDVTATTLGGIIGVLIGLLWGDPFRDAAGRFLTQEKGFVRWVLQIVVGSIAVAMVMPSVMSFARSNLGVIAVVVGAVAFAAYLEFIDPR